MLRYIQALICMVLALGATAVSAVASERPARVLKGEDPAGSQINAIGRVNPGNGAYCTGALVAKNLVVTAAHCLIDPRSKRWIRAGSLHFLGGYESGDYDFHARVSRYTVSPAYDPAEPTKHLKVDWAILVLSEAAPSDSTPIRLGAPAAEPTVAEVRGYAMRRKYALSTSAPCRLQMVEELLVGECNAVRGMSGGPLIEVSTGEMIGMQVAGGRHNGRDVMVAVPSTSWTPALDAAR